MQILQNRVDVRLANNKMDIKNQAKCHIQYLTMILLQLVKTKLH